MERKCQKNIRNNKYVKNGKEQRRNLESSLLLAGDTGINSQQAQRTAINSDAFETGSTLSCDNNFVTVQSAGTQYFRTKDRLF